MRRQPCGGNQSQPATYHCHHRVCFSTTCTGKHLHLITARIPSRLCGLHSSSSSSSPHHSSPPLLPPLLPPLRPPPLSPPLLVLSSLCSTTLYYSLLPFPLLAYCPLPAVCLSPNCMIYGEIFGVLIKTSDRPTCTNLPLLFTFFYKLDVNLEPPLIPALGPSSFLEAEAAWRMLLRLFSRVEFSGALCFGVIFQSETKVRSSGQKHDIKAPTRLAKAPAPLFANRQHQFSLSLCLLTHTSRRTQSLVQKAHSQSILFHADHSGVQRWVTSDHNS